MLAGESNAARVLRPLIFTRPVRLAWPPSWAGHIPFAFWIIDALRPKTFVELGTHSGVSYSAFVQAVQTLGLDTACYAIDTWAGDDHAGFYDEGVYLEWAAFHERHFGGTSRLVRSTFDAAVEKFSNGSIDLLHIDGLHTYDAVRHDFEIWLPKLSPRGVVLFHDVNVREGDFGAWKLWEELRGRYPSFSFTHGHGLGMLAVGGVVAPEVAWLSEVGDDEASAIQRIFATIGDLWVTHIMLDRARTDAAWAAALPAHPPAPDDAAPNHANDEAGESRGTVGPLRQENEAGPAPPDALHSLEIEPVASRTEDSAHREIDQRGAEIACDQGLGDPQAEAIDVAAPGADEPESVLPTETDPSRRLLRGQALLGEFEARRKGQERLRQVFTAAAQRQRQAVGVPTGLRRQLAAAGLGRRDLVGHPLESARALAGLAHPGYRSNAALLFASGLFDPAHYGAQPAAARVPRARLREHFIRHGDRAAISPHALFDSSWYREQNPDLPAGTRLLFHYLRFGKQEGRDAHPLFSADHYLRQGGSAAAGAISPVSHFLEHGAVEGLAPHPLFDVGYYLSQCPALVIAGHNPLVHYLVAGHREHLDPHPLFSARYYTEHNPDLGEGTNPLYHFVRYGAAEGRSPHPLFDVAYYWRQRPDVRAARTNALAHYLRFAAVEANDPHPLFDTAHYLEQLPDSARGQVNPLVHFVEGGWRLGFTPNRWFDPLWYLARYPDLDPAINPLIHYATRGWREGRDPSPRFSSAGYLAGQIDATIDDVNPLVHYLDRVRAGTGAPEAPRAVVTTVAPTVFRVDGRAPAQRTILVVSHVAPWPVRAGNEYRVRRLLSHWRRQGYRVVLVLAPIASEPLADGAFSHIAAEFGNVVVCYADGRVQYELTDCPDTVSALAGTVVRPVPLGGAGTSFAETDRAFCHDVVFEVTAALLHALGRVTLVAEYIFMTRIMSAAGPGVLKVVDTIDVFSQKGANVIAYGVADAEMLPDDERRRLERADVVVAIHPSDAQALRALASREVITAGVDAEVVSAHPWQTARHVFTAGSANALNLAGLRDFVRFAWPLVRDRVPGATLRVAGGVGRAVPPGTPGVDVLGYVEDLAGEYARARVAINPTVAGTGLKIKTVEAIAHLVPVVGWPHGRDGLPARFSRFVHESSDWHDFAAQVAAWLEQRDSPFDAAAIEDVRRELSPETAYGNLDQRLSAFFATQVP